MSPTRHTLLSTAALLGLCLRTPAARAAPFDPRLLPADAKWVVHVDVDALRGSAVGQALIEKLLADARVQQAQRQVASTGVAFSRDLHDVTMYGRTAATDRAAVVVVHARLDRAKVTDGLRGKPGVAVRRIGAHDVFSGAGGHDSIFAAFHGDGTLVVALTEANLTAALDALDAKVPTAPAGGPLTGATPATTRPAVPPGDRPLVLVAVADLAGLVGPGVTLPAFQPVSGGCLAVTEVGPDVVVRANLTTTTPLAAEQLLQSAEGLKAMLALAGTGADADPKLLVAKALAQRVALGQADRTVTADLSVPVQQVRDAIQTSALSVRASTAPSTEPGIEINVIGEATTRPAAVTAGH